MYKVTVNAVYGNTQKEIHGIVFDSREVKPNDIFVAQKGLLFDGHRFIDSAIESGANTIICETLPENLNVQITYVEVKDSNSALAIIAANYFDNPSSNLKLIGITGTNGKTTIATLLYELFQNAKYKSGLISTVNIRVDKNRYETQHTTPNSVAINKYLNEMVSQGVEYCFMEVSSHGIHQKRTEGLSFAGAVFTNLTHDHLDYHKTFAAYRDIKKSLFDRLSKSAFALTNIDDKNGRVMVQNTRAKKFTYAVKTMADFKGRIIENQFTGLLLSINQQEVWTKLTGGFNAYNLLAVYGVANLLGMDSIKTLTLLSELKSVSGRFEYFLSNKGITAVIDYAHTPDALKNVLETINEIRTGKGDIITVVGCGGDRDKAKRPVMGRIAAHLSTQVIFTSDNPRTEDPQEIIRDIEQGVSAEKRIHTLSILDREQAIKTASKLAKKGDIILIAGKGHENYQEINGKRFPFDDMEKITEMLSATEN